MKNPATNSSYDDFNDFTLFLYNAIKEGRSVVVRLRSGQRLNVGWYKDEGPEYEYFYYKDDDEHIYMVWNNDGTSITSHSFDMMELFEV